MTAPTVRAWLGAAAERFGEAPALRSVDGDFALTHRGLACEVQAIGQQLAGWGIGRNDVVLASLPDSPHSVVLYLAVASVATVLPVGEIEEREEYLRILGTAPAAAILMRDRPRAVLTRLAHERDVVLFTADPDRASGLRLANGRTRSALWDPVSAGDDAFLVQTSGTTAEPKIVAITHESLYRAATEFSRWIGFGNEDRALCMMPIVHLHSFVRSSLPVLMAGGEVVWAPGFNATGAPRWIDALRPTWISAAPAIHRGLLAAVDHGWAPPPVARIGVGSDRIEPEEVERLGAVFAARVIQFYGMTETTPFVAMTPAAGSRGPASAVGRVNPSWSVAIVDESGRSVPAGDAGEIVVHGGLINPLLRADGTRAQRVDEKGRLRTSDLGRIDAEDFLHIEGRTDDQINRGGEKIAPAPVETVLLGHASVARAVVFGQPDPVLGRRVAAAVRLKEGAVATEGELIAFAAARLSRIMCPERIVFTTEFPTTAAGKISRAALAEMYPGRSRAAGPQESSAFSAEPAEQIRLILARILQRPHLGPGDDFFNHGGDSLLAMEALIEFEQTFGANIPPAVFMHAPTAAALADLIELARREGRTTRLDVVREGQRPPLLFAYGVGGKVGFAPTLAESLGGGPALFAFECGEVSLADLPSRTMHVLADECARIAIRRQSDGPFVLAGYSFGAQLAVAIAQHLVMMGTAVAFIGIVDDEADLNRRNFDARAHIPASTDLQAINRWTLDRTPVPFHEGRIAYFAAGENAADRFSDKTSGWSEIALDGVDVIEVEGSHHSFEQAPGLALLGPLLCSAVELAVARPEQWARVPARPDPERAFRLEARLAAREGDLQRELAACRSAFQIDPEQPVWFMRHHAEALTMVGNTEGAIQAARAAVARDPWPLASLVLLAPTMRKLGQRGFLQRMKHMADVVPATHPSVEVWRARAYTMIGLGDLAERFLLRGLAEAPNHLKLRRALSRQYSRRKRFAEAATVQHSIVRDYPSLTDAWRRLGELHLNNGDPGAAIEALRLATRLRADDPRVWQLLSRCLDRLDRKDEASEAREQAASLFSSDAAPETQG